VKSNGHAAERSADSLTFLVFALTLGHTIASMAMLVVPAVAPAVADDFGVDPSLIGYLISFVGAGFATSLLFLGNLSRRLGPARAYQCGHATIACGLLVMAVPSVPVLVAGSYAIGVGHGLLAPAASTLLMHWSPPERRNFVFSVQQTGVPLGGMIAALTAPVIAVTVGWRWSLLVTAVLLVVMVAIMQRGRAAWDTARDPSAPAISRHPLANFLMIWRHPRMRVLGIAGGCFAWGQFVVASYTVVASVSALGMSLIIAGTVLTVVQLGNVGGRILAGWLADRVKSSTRVLAWASWAMLVTALFSWPMDAGWPHPLVYALFALHGMSTGAWAGLVLAEVGRLAPQGHVGGAVSGAMVYVNIGKLIGPILFAGIYTVTSSYGAALASLAVPAAIALACLRNPARHA
jgi:predicted MFS family arabinose efflux permease